MIREGFAPVMNAELYYREVGQGRPIIVIHGGPDFDHRYLLPDMDRLADQYRLIYYDQRGLGRSRGEVRLEGLSIEQYLEDLEGLRTYLGLEAAAILGHSWGGHVAMHYALRHPDRTSHMVLLNTAPASHEDYLLLRQERLRRLAAHEDKLKVLTSSAEFTAGSPAAVTEYYRIVFGSTIKRPEHLERLNLYWPQDEILRGRAIEDRLMEGLYWSQGFTLLPELRRLRVPTLVIHGDYDFVPVSCAAGIAEAVPGARLAVLKDCGHFAYIEAPYEVRRTMDDFFGEGREG